MEILSTGEDHDQNNDDEEDSKGGYSSNWEDTCSYHNVTYDMHMPGNMNEYDNNMITTGNKINLGGYIGNKRHFLFSSEENPFTYEESNKSSRIGIWYLYNAKNFSLLLL